MTARKAHSPERSLDSIERHWRNCFRAKMSSIGECAAFIDPVTRKVLFRNAVQVSNKRALPPGAVHVGTYRHPASSIAFIEDVRAAMALCVGVVSQ